jgi:hypothetical protein
MPNIDEQGRMIRHMNKIQVHKRPPGNTEGHDGEQRLVKFGGQGVRWYVRVGGQWWFIPLRTSFKTFDAATGMVWENLK